ncbi:MAG: alanine racemase, partial [Bdellovibrionales bacterium]|nr:alanine racemase [Bdellovibrionales bacterium]
MNLFRKTFAEINVSGLKSNVKWIQDNFPQAPFLCPMVKGNAYGHGDFIIAK